jgi:hypothetical protein
LDIIEIPMIEPRPHGFQSENHLIDAGYYWRRQRAATWLEVRSAVDSGNRALWDNSSSSYNGLHDRVAEAVFGTIGSSLKLIDVTDLSIQVSVEGAEFGNGKRKVRGRFTYSGVEYLLSVTDPILERRYLQGANGIFPIGNAILCISLGEPYQGHTYKLIAAVMTAK